MTLYSTSVHVIILNDIDFNDIQEDEMSEQELDYARICTQYKDLVESMAFVALQKMKKPSPYSFEDLCQEGYIVCVEWVKRWFHPERGASLKTFITGGLRQHFTDLVWGSFRDKSVTLGEVEDPDGISNNEVFDPVVDCPAFNPIENASFNETVGRLTQEELVYVTTVLTPIEVEEKRKIKRKMPTRADVRKALKLSEEAEGRLRAGIEEKLTAQLAKR